MADLITLHTFNTREEAEVAKGFLGTHKVKAFVIDPSLAGISPAVFLHGVELKVFQQDRQKASELLDQKNG